MELAIERSELVIIQYKNRIKVLKEVIKDNNQKITNHQLIIEEAEENIKTMKKGREIEKKILFDLFGEDSPYATRTTSDSAAALVLQKNEDVDVKPHKKMRGYKSCKNCEEPIPARTIICKFCGE